MHPEEKRKKRREEIGSFLPAQPRAHVSKVHFIRFQVLDTNGANILFLISIYHIGKIFSTNFGKILRKSPNGTENPPCLWCFYPYGTAFCTTCFYGGKYAGNRTKSGAPGRAHRFFQAE